MVKHFPSTRYWLYSVNTDLRLHLYIHNQISNYMLSSKVQTIWLHNSSHYCCYSMAVETLWSSWERPGTVLRIRHVCLVHAHSAHTWITFESTRMISVSSHGKCFWAIHLCAMKVSQETEELRKMAKHLLKVFRDLRVWSLLKMARRFLCFASCCSSLSYSSSLPQASQGLHFRFPGSLLALSSSLLNSLTMRTLASLTTVLRAINLHNLASTGYFALLCVTNYIPNCDHLQS